MNNTYIKILLLCTLFLFLGKTIHAQGGAAKVVINGVVTDNQGDFLPGITVVTSNGKNKVMTNANGEYNLTITDNSDYIVFSCTGYRSQERPVGAEPVVDATLDRAESYKVDETVYLGYSTQRRGDISGAVSTVTGEELQRSPVPNLSQALTGRLSGLFAQEIYSEPSRANTALYSRGISAYRYNYPLVILDGIVSSYHSNQTFEYISASEIESVSLLKDASTLALYGIQGANGVLVVTTKRGIPGKLKIDVRFDQTFEQMSTKPTFINSTEYATMRNQAAFNDGKGTNYFYADDQINKFSEGGQERQYYPNNNWRDMFLKDMSNMQRLGMDVYGGNDRAVFYTNVNAMHQGGFYNTDQDEYNANSNFLWANFRTNVDVKLTSFLNASLKLSGNVKRERTPRAGGFMDNVYSNIMILPSAMYGPVTPSNIDEQGVETGRQVVVTDQIQDPAYALINRSGYTQHTVTNIYSQFGLNLDMSFLANGLDLTGFIAYQTNSVGSLSGITDYSRWVRTSDLDELEFTQLGTAANSFLRYGKSSSFYYNLTYKGLLTYMNNFGRHQVSGLAYAFYQDLTTENTGAPASLPYKRISSGVELAYGYDNRYLVKFDLGYSGSEQYAPSNRFIATPAVSGAWVVSNESFMQGADWLSNLKLRASYGKTANDLSDLGRFAYMDNVTLNQGGYVPYLQYSVSELQAANPDIQAEISTKQNYGIDIGLFDNLSVSVDVFQEKMDNMVTTGFSTVPYYQGVPWGNYPKLNRGKFENKGYEISVDYIKSITRDLTINVGGFVNYAKNKVINCDEAEKAEDYAYRKTQEGYSAGQAFGYLIDYHNGNGYFNTQEELDHNLLIYDFGTPRLGDFKYYDLNNDGHINEKDRAPLGFGEIPRYSYAFYGKANYKNFDFSVLFQGIGQLYTMYSTRPDYGAGVVEYGYNGVFSSLHRNAWTQERYNNNEAITYPALSTQKSVSHESNDFFLYDRSFLRLKNLEIGYTLPGDISKKIGAQNIRFVLSGQNLFTWDKMKTDDFGPEAGLFNGQGYRSVPVYRFYNIGVSVKF